MGGGGSSELPKLSRHREETAAASPGLENLPLRADTGEAKSWKNRDWCRPDLGVLRVVAPLITANQESEQEEK